MKDIIIVCAGTFGIDVYNTIMSINRVAREAGREEPYRLLGFLNDIPGTLDGQGLDVAENDLIVSFVVQPFHFACYIDEVLRFRDYSVDDFSRFFVNLIEIDSDFFQERSVD